MPSYHYERSPATASDMAACYRAQRFALVKGEATWRKQYQSGDYLVTETWGADGLAFVRGGHTLDAETAIAALPDRQLAGVYHSLLAGTSSAHAAYPRWRNLAFGLAFGGLAMVGGALAIAVDDVNSPAVTPLALGGAALAVFSIFPALLSYQNYERAITHDLDHHLFRHTDWADGLTTTVRSYNDELARRCGLPAGDLPIATGAASLLAKPRRPAPPAPPVVPPPPPAPLPLSRGAASR